MADSFVGLVGNLSGDTSQQFADSVDVTDVCRERQQVSTSVTPLSDLFGGNEFVGDSMSQMWDQDPIASEPAEGHGKPEKSDVPLPKSEYNRLLFEARMNSMSDAEVKLPWERGIWKRIFSDDDDDVFPAVVPPVPGEYLFPTTSQTSGHADTAATELSVNPRDLVETETALPFYTFAVRVLPDRDAVEEDNKVWLQALHKWQQVFEILNYPGAVGTALLQEQLETNPDASSVVLRDSLGIKSPRTALKRAQTLLQYFSWLQHHVPDWSPWDRIHCLSYLGSKAHARSSASRGMALLESFRFARFVLEIPIPEQLLCDPQLRGRAQRLMAEKEEYKPARPLKVMELASLERMIETHVNPIDVYMLGAIIFAVLSRSRWSDLKLIHHIWVEKVDFNGELYGFVEARTRHHKTATTLAKKQRYMPLVAPVLGVTTVDWTKHWLEAMEALGLDLAAEPFGALCKAPSHEGKLCRRSCTTEEIGAFLNKVLKTTQETGLTSHSLKHTTLSWCAAYGMDEPARTLLGHHELQGAKAMTVYSRDLLTRPLQLYCSMLANIRLDHFRPDDSRTSRMVDLMRISATGQTTVDKSNNPELDKKTVPEAARSEDELEPTSPLCTEAAPTEGQQQDQEESSDIASTSSSSTDSSEDGDEGQPTADIPGPVWRNIRSHVVHRCSAFKRQTRCGRLADEGHFEYLADGCSTINARCSRCFRGEVVTNLDGLVEALDQSRAKRQRAK